VASLRSQITLAHRERDSAVAAAADLAIRFRDVEDALETLSLCSRQDAARLRLQGGDIQHCSSEIERLRSENALLLEKVDTLTRCCRQNEDARMRALEERDQDRAAAAALKARLDDVHRGAAGPVIPAAEPHPASERGKDLLATVCREQERKIVDLLQAAADDAALISSLRAGPAKGAASHLAHEGLRGHDAKPGGFVVLMYELLGVCLSHLCVSKLR
jgi:hypothetical protein